MKLVLALTKADAQASEPGTSERRARFVGKPRAANVVGGARGAAELLVSLVEPPLREQRLPAPAPRLGGKLAEACGLHQRKQLR